MIRLTAHESQKSSISKIEYLHLSFNKWLQWLHPYSINVGISCSLKYNNGEDCWFGNGQKDIDTFHKEGKSQRSLLKEVAVQGVLY